MIHDSRVCSVLAQYCFLRDFFMSLLVSYCLCITSLFSAET
ncbi:hypothetical protein OIU79_006853 [Salix purpurea]|uniref:Uncharacterized protein n=1 Tax=Salix purpurea TaxID=77065 RepID=A0A9Q0Z2J0_SALPP|nr:hypothetical protein OIU79_006853 [Salix purpurea]